VTNATPPAAVTWLATQIAPPVSPLARPAVRLFLTSAVILFVELVLIRWIPANVTYVGFFRNFLLMASFVGIGAGILFGRDQTRFPLSPFALVLLGVTALVGMNTLEVEIPTAGEVFFGLGDVAASNGADPGFLVLSLIVVLTSICMAALALPLGRLLTSLPPLRAYAIDITGSMTGIAAYVLMAALGTAPVVWFAVGAGVLALLALGAGLTRWSIVSGGMLVGVLLLSVVQQPPRTGWSPYYRISEHDTRGGGLALFVNGIPHQGLWPVDDPPPQDFYGQVYRWFPERSYEDVLIVGAGSGSDVAVALAHGAGHVDAVEIDAYLQDIGIQKHPDRPYSDPRVTRTVDDGRAFLRRSTDKYDLVIFALPDSLTLVSTSANIRLESFLFTREAFSSVRDHLADDGMFVVYNYYREPWLVAKIERMLKDAFGGNAIVRLYPGGSGGAATFAAGPAIDALNGAAPPGDAVDVVSAEAPAATATDDWPFLYLLEPSLPNHYLIALALVLGWFALLVGRASHVSRTPLRRFSPHFFVLGVAFLLLETRSIVTFSLLFGSTWLVNALVFFAVLASVLFAILVASRLPAQRPTVLYVALFASIAIAYLLPPASLLIEPVWLRYAVAGMLAFAPVFFANLVFSYSFRDTRTADMAFASNLLGAAVGGAIEYIALVTGYQALLLLVAALYAGAWLLATRVRLLADVDLTVSDDESASIAQVPASA
jgi:spermine/spermidine synthase